MNRNLLIATVIIIIVIIGTTVIIAKNNQTSSPVAPVVTTTPTTGEKMERSISPTTTTTTEKSIKEFTVNGSNMKFEPNTLTVKKGDTVRITFKNVGGMHDFVIDEFNIKTKVLQADTEEMVEFVADKTGTFEYYCSVGKHREMGMKGTLTVN